MTLDAAFFKKGETLFDVFYPTGYVLAVLPVVADLGRAAAAVREAGFAPDEIGVADQHEAMALLRAVTEHQGAFVRYERFLASHRGDEIYLEEDLLALAHGGHGFLFVYAPSEDAAQRATVAVQPFAPVRWFKYGRLTITEWR